MNERIKELAEQARQEFLKLPTGYKPEHIGMYPQLMEKFAKLIVKECVREFVRKLPVSVNVSNRAAHVFKHFGVEE